MRWSRLLIIIISLGFFPAALSAQAVACSGGRVVPYFGWDATECTNCMIRGSYIEFMEEPKIGSIRADGPAAGRLKEHDTLVAVDGLAITTVEAWHRLRDAKAGETLVFTVRNEGVKRDESIRVATRCGPAPSRERPPRIIVRRKGAV